MELLVSRPWLAFCWWRHALSCQSQPPSVPRACQHVANVGMGPCKAHLLGIRRNPTCCACLFKQSLVYSPYTQAMWTPKQQITS
ncbi:hypothetical protein F5144DRAFT_29912 [Chaetomium tenue]|uniref:Uncharacterized protein n=1 Tax=Chaetomium tenue TaxID=1854479 RepID=A0ACB7PP22_9PEZI|nr:hypothetical protein F5144DRAFT_29912 [Chaetomium globosum]